MDQNLIKLVGGTDTHHHNEQAGYDAIVAQCLTAAELGSSDALFDLGVIFSTGDHGVSVDLVEAHKWFNLAAVTGHDDATGCRADVAEDMTAREIAEAQRRALEWLRASPARRVA